VKEEVNNTEWKRRMIQILTLDPINRRRVLKVLLDHADECGMDEDMKRIFRLSNEDNVAKKYLKILSSEASKLKDFRI
jgi:DNA-binding transcriptional regulator/RsmH inhibitor MraZ